MSGLWMHLICLSVLTGSVYAGKGSAASNACHVKCDMVQELTLLRQLLNQESILRINTNKEIQELKTMIKDVVTEHRQNRDQVNTTIEDITMKIDSLNKSTHTQLTEMTTSLQRLEGTTDSKIENVKATVQRTRRSITALETDNISIKQGQSNLESLINTLQNEHQSTKQGQSTLESSVTALQKANQAARQDITTVEISIATMQNDDRVTKQKLTTLESSHNSVQTDTRATRRDLTTLERTVTRMNQTYQGNYALSSNKLDSFLLIFWVKYPKHYTFHMLYFIFFKRLCN